MKIWDMVMVATIAVGVMLLATSERSFGNEELALQAAGVVQSR